MIDRLKTALTFILWLPKVIGIILLIGLLFIPDVFYWVITGNSVCERLMDKI